MWLVRVSLLWKNVKWSSFSKIDAGGNLEVHISKKYTGIEVNAESNLMKYIHTYVEGETLFVEIADTDGSHIILQPLESIKVFVEFEKITDISLHGGAEMASEALIAEGVEVRVDLSGGSEAIIDEITSEDLTVNLSGGSDINCVWWRSHEPVYKSQRRF